MSSSDIPFHSPTYGQLTEPAVVGRIRSFIVAQHHRAYRLIIGSDSLPSNGSGSYLVTAVVLHRVGNGGIYFWHRTMKRGLHSLRERMYAEALASINMAQRLEKSPALQKLIKSNLEIHVDVGEEGPTREMIHEIVGMIVGYGYSAKIKPDSFAASKVADRHTIPVPRLAFAEVAAQQ
ncbi:MAG: ribonuclease H-like YkuK family protein [Candidatus Kerfeldbacteria bacterium]|nr:ribonuclease H-like YkuK family protein [Candidatus Kerfeldbacteria bacterium]